jgi:hypothetical protein
MPSPNTVVQSKVETMSIKTVRIDANECHCERCGAVWIPKPVQQGKTWITPTPIACAKCKSPYWNREKQRH